MPSDGDKLAPFYFLVVFWGPKHRGYFVDYCLSSLLAPGNIPALENKDESRFVICTTESEWVALQDDPLFRTLSDMVRPEWIKISMPDPDENKMNVMSRGHKMLMERVFAARAFGINLNPDTIFADGAVEKLQQLARAGKKLVFHAAIRFELEGVTRELAEKGYWKVGKPLAVKPRAAVDIALRHKHAELRACDFDVPFFWDFPVHTSLDVPGEHGMAIHCFSWAPVLVSYRDVRDHNTDVFEDWTLDGDYIHKNFADVDAGRDVHVVRDSDEMFLLSITPRDEAVVPDTPHWSKSSPVFGRLNKAYLINIVFNDARIDPMKKVFFLEPVLMHSKDLNDRWREVKFMLLKNIRLCLVPPDVSWGGYSIKNLVDVIRLRRYDDDLQHPSGDHDTNAKLGGRVSVAEDVVRKSIAPALIKIRIGLVRSKFTILRIPALVMFYGYHETIRRFVLVYAYSRIIVLAALGNKTEQGRILNRWRKIRSTAQSGLPGGGDVV